MKIKLLFLVVLAGISACSQTGKKSYQSAISDSRDSINRLTERAKIPGLAVTVMIKGEVVWSEGFGHADMEQDVHVDPAHTKFRIGSISKALTAAGLAKLYEQQTIILDSSIYFYLPNYPLHQYRPTVRQLAGHIAGVRHYKGDEFLNTRNYPTVTDGLSMFKDDSLLFQPGQRFEYTSHGFNLLSAVMEKAAAKEFLSFMQETVFDPLNLTETCADKNDSIIASRTRFYEISNDRPINAPYVNNSYKWAGGGFISTSVDIARFGNALLGDSFLKKETITLFHSPQELNDGTFTDYGMGFFSGKDGKQRSYFGHSGGSVGGTTDMVIYPEEKIVVVILTNLSSAQLGDMTTHLANLYLPQKQ